MTATETDSAAAVADVEFDTHAGLRETTEIALRRLESGATLQDLIYELQILVSIEDSLLDADNGKGMTLDEFTESLRSCRTQ